MTAEIIYEGQLRTRATHLQSGNTLITDAPTDNHGRGEAFSPTDMVAAALGACMMTIMGIVADRHGINLVGTLVRVKKIMQANPRKIAAIEVYFSMPAQISDPKDRQLLENAARTCPVALSLHSDIRQDVVFDYTAHPLS